VLGPGAENFASRGIFVTHGFVRHENIAVSTISENKIIGVDAALVFDIDLAPIPGPPGPSAYDPEIHNIIFEKNFVRPEGAEPTL
jgi:hypothetical protein